jgi:hypothetical protein
MFENQRKVAGPLEFSLPLGKLVDPRTYQDPRRHSSRASTKAIERAAQRCALPACGRAWTLLGSRKKLEARKMLLNRADSHTSGARFVSLRFLYLENYGVALYYLK